MWAFASRQFRRWMVLVVGVPVAAWALDRLGERLEARSGETLLSQAVRTGGAALHRQERGPVARRLGGAAGEAGRAGGTGGAAGEAGAGGGAPPDGRGGGTGGGPGPVR